MLSPVFVPGARGNLHCARFVPEGPHPRDVVLLLPPFAEEMNKSRRMLALLGHALVARGVAAWLPDHFGTGDSEGDFGDADWSLWQSDLRRLLEVMRDAGAERLVLAGVRTGALQAVELVADCPMRPVALLFWQPVTNGPQYLKQFLRLRQVAGMTRDGGGEGIAAMRERLDAGETLEVAGYRFAPALARALGERRLAESPEFPTALPVAWFEVTSNLTLPVSPGSQRVIDAWRAHGVQLGYERIHGDSFWGTQELVDVPTLIDASTELIVNHLSADERA